MDVIGKSKLWAFFDEKVKSRSATNTEIRKGAGHKVRSFLELATKVAELQFMNRDHVLLFRGQNCDYSNNQDNTSLKPTLFRSITGAEKNPTSARLIRRFTILEEAEAELVRHYSSAKLLGVDRLTRHRILRWAILQHYEVCKTPLLDLTHSLRIAASFASLGATDKAFLFVLGVPNLSGAITASAEGGLQIVRLSSVCPPSAVRPHIQEGYLLGEYPDLSDFQQKEHYAHYETDFGRRLVSKFYFNPSDFEKKQGRFPMVNKGALYPDSSDLLFKLTQKVKASIDTSEA